jgi:hypothetical protein
MSRKKNRKSQRTHEPAEQVDLPLPPPPGPPLPAPAYEFAWWQKPAGLAGLVALAALLLVAAAFSMFAAHRDRVLAASLESQLKTRTLQVASTQRALRIAPNPRSWSASPDAIIEWPDPPELLDLYLPVAYTDFTTFGITVDKVEQGRILVVQRMAPDSNRELRLSLNSSAFGSGEYRIRIEGYNWRGERADAGWVRLVVK